MDSPVSTAIVLAGGLGTRLRSILPDIPKAMAPIHGRPFLEYLMDYWIAQGITNFVIAVGYLSDQIIGYFGEEYRGCKVQYSIEEVQLGTGGSLLAAKKYLNNDEPFLLLNGDTFFEIDLMALQAFHQESGSEWTFCMFRAAELGRYMGMQVGSDGRLIDAGSILGGEGALANGGVYLINPRVLAAEDWTTREKFSLEADLVPQSLKRGLRFFGFESNGEFIDIGMPGDFARAPSVIRSRLL